MVNQNPYFLKGVFTMDIKDFPLPANVGEMARLISAICLYFA